MLGDAEVTTPLLDQPLTGQVYLRSSDARAARPGRSTSRARSTSTWSAGSTRVKNGALRTTFEAVPDAPVDTFKLDLAGGSKGLLINSESLCGKAEAGDGQDASARTTRVVNTSAKLQTSCGSKQRHKRQRSPQDRAVAR